MIDLVSATVKDFVINIQKLSDGNYTIDFKNPDETTMNLYLTKDELSALRRVFYAID